MNFLDIGLAFLEGLALIVSPCILPVLPLVLSAAADGGRGRPYGIILGFILSFTAFALGSRKVVLLLGIDPGVIRTASLVLLLAFGLVLLSSKLSQAFSALTQRVANAGARQSGKAGGGLFSGLIIGSLIGLVWTPCAGPIFAAVLVQVIRQQSDVAGLFITGAFAVGASVPMLAIALTGRKIMGRLEFFTNHAETIRKVFGLIIIASVALIASGVDVTSWAARGKYSQDALMGMALQKGLEQPYAAPEFEGLHGWLNSQPLTMEGLRGKVVLIDFWTYSCINCIRTLPYITAWDEKYRDKGLVVIGVHAPEFEFEKNADNVKMALKKYGIKYPVALDNSLSTWEAFDNRYWPAHYLIDKDGKVVYTHFGEGHYDITENNIRYLLGLTDGGTTMEEHNPVGQNQSPETYLGYFRAKNYAGIPQPVHDAMTEYTFPEALERDEWALSGSWNVQREKITSGEGAALRFDVHAKKIFLVLGTIAGAPVEATVMIDGQPAQSPDVKDGRLVISEHRLYQLAESEKGRGLLEIKADPGLEAYAFTFGN